VSDERTRARALANDLRSRLRARLRGASSTQRLETAGAVSSAAALKPARVSTAALAVGEPSSWAREPERDGSLLVWNDRFFAVPAECAHGADESTEALFGASLAEAGGMPRAAALLEGAGVDWADLVFVDIETCGLADDPIFLVGVAYRSDEAIVLEQCFAPDPTGEPELVRRTAATLGARSIWVSFNGKSFDIPRLRRRARTHAVEFPAAGSHRDLLHEVRRRWKGRLPNCRLSTVEESLLGLCRLPGDVPGREVPERYWDFVRGGERRWIDPVIEHNRRDVAALVALLCRVTAADAAADARAPAAAAGEPETAPDGERRTPGPQGNGSTSTSVPLSELASGVSPPTRSRKRRP